MGIITWILSAWCSVRDALWSKKESKRDRRGSQSSGSSLVPRDEANSREETPPQHVAVTMEPPPKPKPEPDTHVTIHIPEVNPSNTRQKIPSISTHHGIINATSDEFSVAEKKSGLQASGASASQHQNQRVAYNQNWHTTKTSHLEQTEPTDLKFEHGNRDLFLHAARTETSVQISNQNLEQLSKIVSDKVTIRSSNLSAKPPIPTTNIFPESHIAANKKSQSRATDTMSEQKPTTHIDYERKPATDKVPEEISTTDATAKELPRMGTMSEEISITDKISEDTSATDKIPVKISTTETVSEQKPAAQKMYEDKLTTETISEPKPRTHETSKEKSTTDDPTTYTVVPEKMTTTDRIAKERQMINAEEKSTTEEISEQNPTTHKMYEEKSTIATMAEQKPTTDTISKDKLNAEQIQTINTMPEKISSTEAISEQNPTTKIISEKRTTTDTMFEQNSEDMSTTVVISEQNPTTKIISEKRTTTDTMFEQNSEDMSTTVVISEQNPTTKIISEKRTTTDTMFEQNSEDMSTTVVISEQKSTANTASEDSPTTDAIAEGRPTAQTITSEENSTADNQAADTVSEEVPKTKRISEELPTIETEEKSATEAISEQSSRTDKMSEEAKTTTEAISEQKPTTDKMTEAIPPTDVIAEKIPTIDTMPEEKSTTDAVSEQNSTKDTILEPHEKLELSIPQISENDIYPCPTESTMELIEQEFKNIMDFCLKKHKELMNKLIDTKQPFTERQLTKYHEDNKEIITSAFKESIAPVLELKHKNVQRLFEERLKNLEKSIKSQLTVSLRKHEIAIEKVTKMVKDCTHAADSEYDDLMDKFDFNGANEEGFSAHHDKIVKEVGDKFDQLLMQKGLEANLFWKLELNQKMNENRAEYVSDNFSSQK